MFTSRVEYRLVIREDNADLRLAKFGHSLGLIKSKDFKKTQAKQARIKEGINYLRKTRISPSDKINKVLAGLNTSCLQRRVSLEELLKRPEIDMRILEGLDDFKFSKDVSSQIEIEVKYAGFIRRQLSEVGHFKNLEKIKLPLGFDYSQVPSLSREIKEKLIKLKPLNLGQASRISGVTPVAISVLMVWLKKIGGK